MTHFVGLVVAETEAELPALLQPFHEYECTGVDDQYVVDVDLTDEAREIYANDTSTRLRDQHGALHSFFTAEGHWDPRFSQVQPDAWDKDRRVKFVPPGYEEVEVPTSEVENFATWAAGYYGSDTVKGAGENVSVIKRANPNKKWDWWVVGGRWSDVVPGNTCLVEDLPKHFPDWQPSVVVDADGWHASKDWGWFGTSSPSETPDIATTKLAQHAGKRVFVVDFHI